MDAARLVTITRFAIGAARDGDGAVAEAWRAHTLVQAVVGYVDGNPLPGVPIGLIGGGRLTSVRAPLRTLRDLLAIAEEAEAALVAIVRSDDDVGLYLRCVEAADALSDAAAAVRLLVGRQVPGPEPP